MSGKGGVGKTALAVNLARIYSEIGDVVLVDMDLQNRGATGVFGSMKLQGPTAEQLLTSDSAKPSPVRVGERLFFVPSALTKLSVDPELRQELHVAQLKERIRVMIEHLTRQLNPILIIMGLPRRHRCRVGCGVRGFVSGYCRNGTRRSDVCGNSYIDLCHRKRSG